MKKFDVYLKGWISSKFLTSIEAPSLKQAKKKFLAENPDFDRNDAKRLRFANEQQVSEYDKVTLGIGGNYYTQFNREKYPQEL